MERQCFFSWLTCFSFFSLQNSFVTKNNGYMLGTTPLPSKLGSSWRKRYHWQNSWCASGRCFWEVGQPKISCSVGIGGMHKMWFVCFWFKKVHWQHNWCCSLVGKIYRPRKCQPPECHGGVTSDRFHLPKTTLLNALFRDVCFLISRTFRLVKDRSTLLQKYMSKLGSSKPLAKNNQPVVNY